MRAMSDTVSLEGHHDFRSLLSMHPTARGKKDGRFRNAEFEEEDLVHLKIIMLTGMDEAIGATIRDGVQCAHDRRDLHKIRPRSGNDGNYDPFVAAHPLLVGRPLV